MKLSQYAKKAGISYKTAWRWYKAGTLDAYQKPTGMVVVRDPHIERIGTGRIASYVRVSYADQKSDLERQVQLLRDYAAVLRAWSLTFTAGVEAKGVLNG